MRLILYRRVAEDAEEAQRRTYSHCADQIESRRNAIVPKRREYMRDSHADAVVWQSRSRMSRDPPLPIVMELDNYFRRRNWHGKWARCIWRIILNNKLIN